MLVDPPAAAVLQLADHSLPSGRLFVGLDALQSFSVVPTPDCDVLVLLSIVPFQELLVVVGRSTGSDVLAVEQRVPVGIYRCLSHLQLPGLFADHAARAVWEWSRTPAATTNRNQNTKGAKTRCVTTQILIEFHSLELCAEIQTQGITTTQTVPFTQYLTCLLLCQAVSVCL